MKRFLLLAAVLPLFLGAYAQDAEDSEWTGIGTGAYQPGLLDFYEDEYPELMPAAVYESTVTPGKYRFVPDPGFVGTTPGSTPVVVYDIIVHAENPDRVWCEDATFFRGIMNLTTRHKVKEASSIDNEANYGKLQEGVIAFSTPKSFQVVDMMGPKDSNLNGKFALYMPGSAPGGDPVVNDRWEVMGMGKYVEGLLDCEYKAGIAWDVEIEKSLDTPGCYRLKPYFEGNPSCPYLPEVADTYIYVHAENDMEVYTAEFTLLNKDGRGYKIQHRAVSGSNPDYSAYGILEDGVITFPAKSHSAVVISPGVNVVFDTNKKGKAAIVLPGVDWQDYFIEGIHPVCAVSDAPGFCKFPITINAGSGVKSAILAVEAGARTLDDINVNEYLTGGTEFPAEFLGFTMNLNFPMVAEDFKTNRWTVVVLALDGNRKVRNTHISTFFTPEKDEDWEDYAEGRFTDLLLGSSYAALNETMKVKIQRKKGTERFLRIVNPYESHPTFNVIEACASHSHYLYINANDPQFVYVEESPVGLDMGYGYVVASSVVGSLLNARNTLEDIKAAGVAAGEFEGDTVYFPAGSLCFFETEYEEFKLQAADEGRLLKITKYEAGVEDLVQDDAAAEYYDLNGIRISEPLKGGIYIKKQGASVTKEIIR